MNVDCAVHGSSWILCLWSRLHETHTNLTALKPVWHPEYPLCVLRFTVTNCNNQEQNLLRNCSCTHWDQYALVADIVRDGEIDLPYVLTASMLAHCFTKPLLQHPILKRCAVMGMIGIVLGNGLRIGNVYGLGNGPGFIGNRNRKWYWNRKWYRSWKWLAEWDLNLNWLGKFVSRRSTMFNWLLGTFLFCFLLETDVRDVLEECGANWEYGYYYAKDYDATCLVL